MSERLNRINELAHIAKERPLTQEEEAERDRLRKEYIAEFRKNLRGELDHIELEYPDKTVVKLSDLRKK